MEGGEICLGGSETRFAPPPFKNSNARFTKIPMKPLSDLCGRYCRFSRFERFYLLIFPTRFPAQMQMQMQM